MGTSLLDPHHPTTAGTPADPSAGAELLARIRAHAPEIERRAAEAEALRALPADLIGRLEADGLFCLALPRTLGGHELSPSSMVEIIEEASRADGSAGWTLVIANSSLFTAWLDPAAAAELLRTEGLVASAMFGPLGRATRSPDGGFVVEGRWPFNSACVHAGWHALGVLVMDGDRPALRPDGRPDWRFAYLSHHDVEVVETWDSLGLRATASHDLVAAGAPVAEDRLAMPMFDQARHDGPLWHLPFFNLLGPIMAAVPLGIGRRALDELAAVAAGTVRGGNVEAPLGGDSHLQVRFSQADAGLRAARALLLQSCDQAWDVVTGGGAVPAELSALINAAVQLSLRAATEAADLAYTSLGGRATYTSHPVQRCFRDVHTASQHLAFQTTNWTGLAKVRFGLPDV